MAQTKYQNKHSDTKQSVGQRKAGRTLVDNRDVEQTVTQRQPNKTGLPDNLKAGMENLAGANLDHVKVHYNSAKPAAVQAHAYAQGGDIHLGAGQEKHLPHELGHVVQQMQGRVKANSSVGGMAMNDNAGLESEATTMGQQALQRSAANQHHQSDGTSQFQPKFSSMGPMGMDAFSYTTMNPQQYMKWKETDVAQRQAHGHCIDGDKVVVTQLSPDLVLQADLVDSMVGGSKKKKALVLGGLLIIEGGLTVAAGAVVAGATSGVAAIPAFMTIMGGIIKVIRGILNISKAYINTETDKGKKAERIVTAFIDILRMAEAVVGLVGAFTGKGNPVSAVQNFSKALRSGLLMYIDFKGSEIEPKTKAVLKSLVAVCHTIEAMSVGFLAASGSNLITGAIAASKTARASNDGTGAVDAVLETRKPATTGVTATPSSPQQEVTQLGR